MRPDLANFSRCRSGNYRRNCGKRIDLNLRRGVRGGLNSYQLVVGREVAATHELLRSAFKLEKFKPVIKKRTCSSGKCPLMLEVVAVNM